MNSNIINKEMVMMIARRIALNNKEILSFDEACTYLDISESMLHKMTASREIKHSKPHGKKIYFQKKDLDNWAMSNPVETAMKIKEDAYDYATSNHR